MSNEGYDITLINHSVNISKKDNIFDWSLLIEGDKLTELERCSSSSDNSTISSAEINDIMDLFHISWEKKTINTTPVETNQR
jgi:hypothetical protein